jgi:hypothetical protein
VSVRRFARTFVFFYSVALHLLVWFTMYRLSLHNVEHIKDCNGAAQVSCETSLTIATCAQSAAWS